MEILETYKAKDRLIIYVPSRTVGMFTLALSNCVVVILLWT